MKLSKISYGQLNAKQQEAFNFQKLSGVLADYGLYTIRLSDDWQGADFIAQHCVTNEFIAVQLKGRFGLWKKYQNKKLWLAFRDGETWYLYNHDEMVTAMQNAGILSFPPSRGSMKTAAITFLQYPKISERCLSHI